MSNINEHNIYLKKVVGYVSSKRTTIFIIVVCSALFGAIFAFIAPKKYEATITILPPAENNSGGMGGILSSVSKSLPFGGLGGGASSTDYYIDIVGSRNIASKIAKEIKFIERYQIEDEEPIDSITAAYLVQNSLSAEFNENGVLEVSSTTSTGFFAIENEIEETKQLAYDILISLSNNFNEFLIERDKQLAKSTKEYIQKEIDRYKTELDSVALILEDFQTENKLLSLEDQTMSTISQASEIGSQIAKTKAELEIAKISYSENSEQVKGLKATLNALEMQYRAAQMGGVSSGDQFSLSLSELPNLARKYAIIYRDREILEQVILFLETQKHQEAIAQTKEIDKIEVLDSPMVPRTKKAPKTMLVIAVAFLISSITTLLILFILGAYKYRSFREPYKL
ncbi:MAG: hypothetical protein Kapaf2KO_14300 [Candidatus Kapaibacteriales bacterium]